MTEQVTITPVGGRNSDGDPTADGTPFTLTALEVAPGNTLLRYGIGGDLDTVEFTVFLPLRYRTAVDTYQPVAAALADDFTITVRNRVCKGRVQEWNSGGRGGVVVLAHSATGRSGG